MRAGLESGLRWRCPAAWRGVPVLLLVALLVPRAQSAEKAGPPAACVAVDAQTAPFMFSRIESAEGLGPARFDQAMEPLRRDGVHDRLVAQALLTQ